MLLDEVISDLAYINNAIRILLEDASETKYINKRSQLQCQK